MKDNIQPVNGLLKGLKLMELLAAQGMGSAGELAQWTGYPRPTVYRLLYTLIQAGYVVRPLAKERFLLSKNVQTRLGLGKHEDLLAEVATPILLKLTQTFAWPCDIATYEDGALIVRATTQTNSTMSIERVRVGKVITILTSATGMAYLAYCSDAQRELLFERLCPYDTGHKAHALWVAELNARIELTRRRGCGLRVRGSQPKTSSIAVPVLTRQGIVCCININWIASAHGPEAGIERYLGPLQKAAKAVARAYEKALQPRASAARRA